MKVEKVFAITIKINDMARSVHFYNRLLGVLRKKSVRDEFVNKNLRETLDCSD